MNFNVKIHPNGGTLTGSNMILAEDGYFILPNPPQREGYNFIRWSKDILDTMPFSADQMPINEDIVLYAQWEPIVYTVIFLDIEGNNQDVFYIRHGDSVESVVEPYVDGYIFDGWYKEEEFKNKYVLSMPIESDLTLYPKFNVKTFSIWYDTGDGGPTIPTQYVVHDECPEIIEAPSWYGHVFVNWYKDYLYKIEYDFSEPITEDTTIYAKYDELKILVTYEDDEGEEVYPEKEYAYGIKLNPPTKPEKEGKSFSHWELNGERFDFDTQIENDILLVAIFTDIVYTVTFEGNGVELKEKEQKVVHGELVNMPEEPEKEGSTFVCWSTTAALDDVFNFSTEVTSDLTLYAKWKEDTYTVTFVVDGEAYDIRTVNWADAVSNTVSTPTKENYSFTGWYDSDDNLFNFSTPIKEDTYIYAQFSRQETSVYFNTNGGTYIEAIVVNLGESVPEPEPPTRIGYEFVGWYSNASFTNEYDFDELIYYPKIIYAKWEICKYLVTINYNDNDDFSEEFEIEYNKTVTKPEIAPMLDGHSFAGWVDITGAPYDFSKPVITDVIIEAKFTEYSKTLETDFLGMLNSEKYYKADIVGQAITIFVDSYVEDNTIDGFTVEDMAAIYIWAEGMLGHFTGDKWYRFYYANGILTYEEKAVMYNIPMTQFQLLCATAAVKGMSGPTPETLRALGNYLNEYLQDIGKGNMEPI